MNLLSEIRRRLLFLERTFWDLHASNWDSLGSSLSAQSELNRRIEVIAGLEGGNRKLVDLGCGTGNYALALAQLGLDVTGVDFSSAMLERARSKAEVANQTVRFVRADLNAPLPFRRDAFSLAICVMAVQMLLDKRSFLAEIRQIISSSGYAFFVVPKPGVAIVRPESPNGLGEWLFFQFKSLAASAGGALMRLNHEAPDPITDSGFEIVSKVETARAYEIVARVT